MSEPLDQGSVEQQATVDYAEGVEEDAFRSEPFIEELAEDPSKDLNEAVPVPLDLGEEGTSAGDNVDDYPGTGYIDAGTFARYVSDAATGEAGVQQPADWMNARLVGEDEHGDPIFKLSAGEARPTLAWLGITAASFEEEADDRDEELDDRGADSSAVGEIGDLHQPLSFGGSEASSTVEWLVLPENFEGWQMGEENLDSSDMGSMSRSTSFISPQEGRRQSETDQPQDAVTPCIICAGPITLAPSACRPDIGIAIHRLTGCGQYAHFSCVQASNFSDAPARCGCGELTPEYERVEMAKSVGEMIGRCALCDKTITVGRVWPIYRPVHHEPCGRCAHMVCIGQNSNPNCLCGRGRVMDFVSLADVPTTIIDALVDSLTTRSDEREPLGDDFGADAGYGTFGQRRH